MKIAESADELEEIKEAHDAVDSDNVESCTLLEKLPDTDDQAVYEVSTSTDGTEDAAAVNKVVLYKYLSAHEWSGVSFPSNDTFAGSSSNPVQTDTDTSALDRV
ncbi:hypothetical protein PF003_g36189 [Phytophthora fragariae]|nr:hypothetical protein PF003_g36189 [Phytophthora fragariae]